MTALKLTRFEDAVVFYDHVWAYLLQNEAEHNVMLGLRQNILNGFYEAPYMACVEDDSAVVAVVLRTPPHPLHLSRVQNLEALPLIAEDVQIHFETLTRVIGARETAQKFAQIWSQRSGQLSQFDMAQGLYQLTAVKSPMGISGEMRVATEDDLDTIMSWIMAFEAETQHGTLTAEEAERITRLRIPSQPECGFRVWCDDGKLVSMAGYTGPTPHGIRINAVYTPPELRGRGYASACVAALSQEMLDAGRRFCFLFTDLSNPISNKIYQNIGYEPVSELHVYLFE